jgi:hypothetical protein
MRRPISSSTRMAADSTTAKMIPAKKMFMLKAIQGSMSSNTGQAILARQRAVAGSPSRSGAMDCSRFIEGESLPQTNLHNTIFDGFQNNSKLQHFRWNQFSGLHCNGNLLILAVHEAGCFSLHTRPQTQLTFFIGRYR